MTVIIDGSAIIALNKADFPPPSVFWQISQQPVGFFLCRLDLFLGGPVLHAKVITASKMSNWIPRDVTGNEGGAGGFLSENV